MRIIKKPIDKWLRFIDTETNECSDQIISLFELSDLIKNIFEDDDCPFKGLRVTIKHYEVEFCSGTLGELSKDSNVKKDPLGTTAECVIEYELKVKIISSTLWYNKFIVFLTSVWLPNLRKFGGLNLKQDELAALLPEALERIYMNSSSQINCIFADLDEFKLINDKIDHETGDKAIQDVLGCIEKAAQDERIISTIDGGDEYIIFIEDKGDTELLLTLDRLRKLIADNKYGDEKLTVGITFGIQKLSQLKNLDGIKDEFKKAEAATRTGRDNIDKKRGTVSFHSESKNSSILAGYLNERACIEVAISLIRSRQNSNTPFSNSILNFISEITFIYFKSSTNCSDFDGYIHEYIKWLGISFFEPPNESEFLGNIHRNIKVSKASFCISIAHGILKSFNSYSLSLKINKKDQYSLVDIKTGESIWGNEFKDADISREYLIGSSIGHEESKMLLSNCILISLEPYRTIPISDKKDLPEKKYLPENLFVDTIVVDSRPKTGGGLPDFWQAAIAQLVDVISDNQINKVIVYGKEENTPYITKLLKGNKDLNIDEIAMLSASYRPKVEKCMSLLKKKDTVVL